MLFHDILWVIHDTNKSTEDIYIYCVSLKSILKYFYLTFFHSDLTPHRIGDMVVSLLPQWPKVTTKYEIDLRMGPWYMSENVIGYKYINHITKKTKTNTNTTIQLVLIILKINMEMIKQGFP